VGFSGEKIMNFEFWHPTPIGIFDVDEQVKLQTQQKVFNWISNNYDSIKTTSEENLSTTYHSGHIFLEQCNLTELYSEIMQCTIEFCNLMGIQPSDSYVVHSWLNLFEKNQTENQHTHYGNFLSGCYYVDSSEKSGAFTFPDALTERDMWKGIYLKNKTKQTLLNNSSGSYLPKPGRMLMFQSWMPHSVLKNDSETTRISIAFNVNPK
jgi:uncharacterized protein (TIGR02466 family)